MATTSLWHIEGRLKDLIAYVENPEKTRADTACQLSEIPIKHRQGRCGWTRKAASRQGIMSTGKM